VTREPVLLNAETRAAVLKGLEQAQRGEFASDEDIKELLRPRPVFLNVELED
jgi:hypothetical protein